MFLFNWFSGKSLKSPSSKRPQGQAQNKSLPGTPTVEVETNLKVKRHARREQLYVAIRECMIRAGVLAASYKFKVLSLDQHGDKFLVMMDVTPELSSQENKLSEIETLLISIARTLFGIRITSVYWRTDCSTTAANFGVNQPTTPVSPSVYFDVAKPV